MKQKYVITVGRAVQKAASLRGGGSALPGLVIEKLDKRFLEKSLSNLPLGVVLVTGTNGKTTTTKIITEMLEAAGLRVFTNRTGSNFTRGIASAVLRHVNKDGKLDYDIAVLELDEAHAVHFVKQVTPTYVLALNVMRDQLDRFGEIDHTARLIEKVTASATKAVVLNRDDERIAGLASSAKAKVSYFAADKSLHKLFVNDNFLHSASKALRSPELPKPQPEDVILKKIDGQKVTYQVDEKEYQVELRLTGAYNFLNAAGALALVRQIAPKKVGAEKLVSSLKGVKPAFGRGEVIDVNGQPVELVLVKNPAGFRLALASFAGNDRVVNMIAINDRYADGRDMSWLWDIDFMPLSGTGVAMVSGIRAYDMALRLQYDDVTVSEVMPDIKQALKYLLKSNPDSPKVIYCTYTAMLEIRRTLAKMTEVNKIS